MYVHTLVCMICFLSPADLPVCVNPLNVALVRPKGPETTTVVITSGYEYVVQGKTEVVSDRLTRCGK
jgi:uncharacterized protein YlzI (FlbEa/FlbD family)